MNKKVSIGVAVYNGETTLKRAIDSLVNQTYKNIEIIIIDDHSIDGSPSIIKKYANEDSRIIYKINKINKGLTNNFNELFNMSNGDYFLWSDQDDYREKTFIDKTLKVLEENPNSVLCHTETQVFFKSPKNIFHINLMKKISEASSISKRYKNMLWYYNDTNIYGLIRSSALKKTSLWKEMNGSSNNLLFQLILLGKFEYINEPLFFYSGKEILERPSIRKEYELISKKKSPIVYSAGLILLKNQIVAIFSTPTKILDKLTILFYLIQHFLLINFSKLLFRVFYKRKKNKINDYIYKLCSYMFPLNSEVKIIVDENKYPKYFPKYNQFRKLK